ncbi:uncharacterized protein BDZ99DRAFT_528550 [Mytilinidion resinicola]|uniref:Uncharacterized protein n=1 Tax=Mytilinidion resinicola TaxID=574789 RepID=A0A6A6Y011_9PEZI|nr:uncharacterized protein BDZ99DRAFT_528550 [Mytilinidion resinicola]KAF2801334.1 hypothetical protein BDZ99DRAFT_528550 [Mytilinidion resinicola]
MPLTPPPQFRRPISTAARVHPAPPQFHASYNPTSHIPTHTPTSTPTVPKVGKIGRWYLPACALVALGWLSSPLSPLRGSPSTSDARAGFAVANALEEHNHGHLPPAARRDKQQERNQHLMDSYGDRMSLADLEKALEVYEVQ